MKTTFKTTQNEHITKPSVLYCVNMVKP